MVLVRAACQLSFHVPAAATNVRIISCTQRQTNQEPPQTDLHTLPQLYHGAYAYSGTATSRITDATLARIYTLWHGARYSVHTSPAVQSPQKPLEVVRIYVMKLQS